MKKEINNGMFTMSFVENNNFQMVTVPMEINHNENRLELRYIDRAKKMLVYGNAKGDDIIVVTDGEPTYFDNAEKAMAMVM